MKYEEHVNTHKHAKMVVRREWYSRYNVSVQRWVCGACGAEGEDSIPWVEPEGMYFGIPVIDHIMSHDTINED